MTAVAKVVKKGSSQSVQLPKAFRVKGTQVFLRHTPEGILITERDRWDVLEEACLHLSDKFLDALENREKRTPQERDWSGRAS